VILLVFNILATIIIHGNLQSANTKAVACVQIASQNLGKKRGSEGMRVILSEAKDLKNADGDTAAIPRRGKALEILHFAALHSG
jgi:hypothetical protein